MILISPLTFEQKIVLETKKNPNMLVPFYLMTSYLYYKENITIVKDETYNFICRSLDNKWKTISHPHKHIIYPHLLKYNSGFAISLKRFSSLEASRFMKKP